MKTTEANDLQSSKVNVSAEQADKKPRTRGKDNGPTVLPNLEHLVHLTRKVQQPRLLTALLVSAYGQSLPAVQALTDEAKGALPIKSRNELFALVAEMEPDIQASLERAAERITLLADEYGALAVTELMDTNRTEDAAILSASSDKFSLALYLYLEQETSPARSNSHRFEHAEQRQQVLRHFQSEKYSSHYLGPKGAQPVLDDAAEDNLKRRLAAGVSIKVTDRLKTNLDFKYTDTGVWDEWLVEFQQPVALFGLLGVIATDLSANSLRIPRGYQSVFSWALGVEYQWNDRLALRMGYEPRGTAIPDDKRDFLVPIGEVTLVTFGGPYKWDRDTVVDFAFALIESNEYIPANTSTNVN